MSRRHMQIPHIGPARVLGCALFAGTAFGSLTLAAPAWAQAPASRAAAAAIEGINPGSRPPLAYIRPRIQGKDVSKVWVTYDQTWPLARPRPDSPRASNGKVPALAFMQGARITAESNGFLLLVE